MYRVEEPLDELHGIADDPDLVFLHRSNRNCLKELVWVHVGLEVLRVVDLPHQLSEPDHKRVFALKVSSPSGTHLAVVALNDEEVSKRRHVDKSLHCHVEVISVLDVVESHVTREKLGAIQGLQESLTTKPTNDFLVLLSKRAASSVVNFGFKQYCTMRKECDTTLISCKEGSNTSYPSGRQYTFSSCKLINTW